MWKKNTFNQKLVLKTYITHTPLHTLLLFSICARVLSIFSLSRNVNRKNPFTLHFARVFALTTIETVHISFITIEKFSHLLQTYYEKFFFVYIDKSIDIAQFFALIKTIQYNNFCYESLITYYLYNFKVISEDSIYFGLIRLDFKIIL